MKAAGYMEIIQKSSEEILMKYTYTAIFTPIEYGSGYYCSVPDLPGCITTGKDLPDAIAMITDAASIWLVGAEDDGEKIPEASPQSLIPREGNAILSMIIVDTIKYRAENDTRAVRKNVSIPAWMDAMVSRRKINCSQVLQDGLRKILENA